ncbi:MAG: UDP-N-acetylmuramate dehydrogenase [Faecalibacterium sp.]
MTDFQPLKERLQSEGFAVREGELLSAHSTFQIGGAAALYLRPTTVQAVARAIALCKEAGVRYYLLGNGSNILFSDAGFTGAVLDLCGLNEITLSEDAAQDGVITAAAGASLARICKLAQGAALSGLEFAYGIPGTLGGAVYMNAGAYGGEMKDVVQSVTALCADGTVREIPLAQLGFAYRKSVFEKNGACILSATLRLAQGNGAQIKEKMDGFMAARREKQPVELPSAGSTFKRPEGAFAAALIDQCGLRGMQVGGAAISQKHCGFVVNLGGASCADVLALCEQVAAIVKEKTGYTLEREIRVVE